MASPTAPSTWSLQDTTTLPNSTYNKPAATQDPTPYSQKTSQYPPQRPNPHNHTNIQEHHVICLRSWTGRPIKYLQRNGPTAPSTHWNGITTTQKFHPMKQLNRSRVNQRDHHSTQNQAHGHEITLVPLQRITTTIQILLGRRKAQPLWIQHKKSPPPYTTFPIGQHIWANLVMLTARVCCYTSTRVTRVNPPSEYQSPDPVYWPENTVT